LNIFFLFIKINLKKKKKKKKQPANSNSDHEGYERHNTEVDGRMHSGESKIADLIGEHLQTKKS